MSDTFTKLAYEMVQQSQSYFAVAHKTISSRLRSLIEPTVEQKTKPLPPQVLQEMQQRLNRLMEADWSDAERGVYPASLLFDRSWSDFFLYYPVIWLDFPQTWERVKQKKYQEFSPEIETEGYPSYYLQNFHHQTDGYLSEMSANLYDLQVELLFNGTADAMRRRILGPLKQGLTEFKGISPRQIRVLDVACGTGRTLKFLRETLPKASLYGMDMSPAYLRKANQLLSEIPGELPQLLQGKAEELPYLDNYFHGVTSVFLFHELPALVRQQVINECFRVTQPGGVLIICDSIQLPDVPEFKVMMENFAVIFHEPYYKNYISDDLVRRLESAGFTNIETQVHLMSKYLIARKPE